MKEGKAMSNEAQQKRHIADDPSLIGSRQVVYQVYPHVRSKAHNRVGRRTSQRVAQQIPYLKDSAWTPSAQPVLSVSTGGQLDTILDDYRNVDETSTMNDFDHLQNTCGRRPKIN